MALLAYRIFSVLFWLSLSNAAENKCLHNALSGPPKSVWDDVSPPTLTRKLIGENGSLWLEAATKAEIPRVPVLPGMRLGVFENGTWFPVRVEEIAPLKLRRYFAGGPPEGVVSEIKNGADLALSLEFLPAIKEQIEHAHNLARLGKPVEFYGGVYLPRSHDVLAIEHGSTIRVGAVEGIVDRVSLTELRVRNPQTNQVSRLKLSEAQGAEILRESPLPLAPESAMDRFKYYARIPKIWIKQATHNAQGIAGVLDTVFFRPLKGGLLPIHHPWVTGRAKNGRPIWSQNILFSTPRKTDFGTDTRLLPGTDEEIVNRVGKFMAAMVENSASSTKHPFGKTGRMPHAVNYLHGAVHHNAGYLVFNDIPDAIAHITDQRFTEEMLRFARETKREILLVFRDRNYSPEEYAYFAGAIRSLLPWFSNTQGPTVKKAGEFVIEGRVLWGNPAPYAVVNPITGNWKQDVYKLARGNGDLKVLEEVAKDPIEKGKFFREQYQGVRYDPLAPERFLARATFHRLRARGKRGNLFFVNNKELLREKSLSDVRKIPYVELAPKTEIQTVVIGGGPAGLSAAQQLTSQGMQTLVLEAGDQVGQSFRQMPTNMTLLQRWQHLSLPNSPSELRPRAKVVSAERYAEYLQDYALAHELPVARKTQVTRIERDTSGKFHIYTADGKEIVANRVINATGYFSQPNLPQIPGLSGDALPILHYASYKDPAQVISKLGGTGKRVLVIGKKLSAGQAMIELERAGFHVSLSTRGPVEFMKVSPHSWSSNKLLGPYERLMEALGRAPKAIADPVMQGGIEKQLIESGRVPLLGDIERAEGKTVVFKDGRREDFDLVFFATGFKPSVSHVGSGVRVNPETGLPLTTQMESIDAPGMYFLGLDQVGGFRSRFLRGIRDDAKTLAANIRSSIDRQPASAVVNPKVQARSEHVYGKEVTRQEVDEFLGTGKRIRLVSPFEPKKDVYLCFMPGCHHTFLVADDLEYHGRLYINRVKVLPSKDSPKAGIMIRFSDLSAEQREKLVAHFRAKDGGRSLNCIDAACQALASADVYVDDGKRGRRFFLKPVFRSILDRGFVDGSGIPVEHQMFVAGSDSMEDMITGMGVSDRKYALPAYAVPVAAVGGALGVLVYKNKDQLEMFLTEIQE